MIVRVDPELNVVLAAIAARLFNETQLDYPRAALIRGLVEIGLASITDAVRLAPLFLGARIPRGRKPGARPGWAEPTVDVDNEHADESADGEGGER